ncbi:hypothetical protein CH75_05965 [Dyella jiangningensis]|nr:hypothetical protein CH75_05965 [Dyella jiangningensis]
MHQHQTALAQFGQMDAGGGRVDPGNQGELGTRSRAAIQECAQHACTRWLSDRRGRFGNASFRVLYIHSLIASEV